MTTINDLPNEILLMIFQKVKAKKQLTRTCKRWNELIVNFLFLSIDLSSEERIRKFMDITFTRSYGQLDIYGVMLVRSDFDWTDSSRQLENAHAKRVRYESDPYVLLRKCLQVVRQYEGIVEYMSLTFGPIMDKSLMGFLPRSDGPSLLESLVIRFESWDNIKSEDWIIDRMEFISEEGLKEISEMPNLKRLEYDDNRSKGDRTARRKFFDAIARKAKAITEIYLSCNYYACFSDFRIIRSFSTQLQDLSCTVYPIFVKDFLQLAFPEVKSLYLDFRPCTTMPDPGRFFENAKSLVDLNVANINSDEFFRQGVYCSSATVEWLTITGNQQIPMDGLQGLIGLKELKLYGYVGSEVQHAVPHSTSLEKLVIERCTSGFSFYGVLAESVPHITELHITEDAALNDECLRVICTTMPNLRRFKLNLDLFLRDPVTDRGLHYIGNLRQLEYLSLECFDDADLIMGRNDLIGFCWAPLLWASEIHLNGFPMINVQNVLDFLLNPNLQSLSLEQCGRNVNMIETVRKIKQLMAVSRPLPHLEIADFW
ncbi:uncharacterized protein LOC109397366 isoform X1 [Aedes albopictus]|uniref:F-box domain-containing protein n=2 Tax=Aedes albopictus TaxID=7160 RepID=A0ABM1Y2R4_AEDAL|nr:uncharacterized protein LOC109420255 isoform X1 [Aedes albopictus]